MNIEELIVKTDNTLIYFLNPLASEVYTKNKGE